MADGEQEAQVFALKLHESDQLPFMALAEIAGRSGFFGCNSQEQAAMKLLLGQELGFPPCASLSGINIIEGKPAASANMRATAIKNHPGYDYKAMVCETECSVEFYRLTGEERALIGTYSITLDEAKERGWTVSGKGTPKENWRRHPDAMLFARAISQGQKFHCPDVFTMAVYDDDELEQPEPIDIKAVHRDEDTRQEIDALRKELESLRPKGPCSHPDVEKGMDGEPLACRVCGEVLAPSSPSNPNGDSDDSIQVPRDRDDQTLLRGRRREGGPGLQRGGRGREQEVLELAAERLPGARMRQQGDAGRAHSGPGVLHGPDSGRVANNAQPAVGVTPISPAAAGCGDPPEEVPPMAKALGEDLPMFAPPDDVGF